MKQDVAYKYHINNWNSTLGCVSGLQNCLPTGFLASTNRLFSGADVDTIFGANMLGASTTGKALVDYGKLKYNIRQFGNNPCYLDVYWCRARKAITVTTWSQPETTFSQGFNLQQSDAGFVVHLVPEVHPYMNQQFCTFWKILSKKTYFMSVGKQINISKKIKNVQLQLTSHGYVGSGSVTLTNPFSIAPLFIIRGSNGFRIEDSTVSTGGCNVLITGYKSYRAMDLIGPLDSKTNVNFINNLSTAQHRAWQRPVADVAPVFIT